MSQRNYFVVRSCLLRRPIVLNSKSKPTSPAKKQKKKQNKPPIASTMRDSVWSKVEIAESSSKLADIDSAVVVGPTALVFCSINSEFVVLFGQLSCTTPFRARQNKILPERPSRPGFVRN